MATISTTVGGEKFVAVKHNLRDINVVSKEEHIQENGIHETWIHKDIKEAYKELFDDSVKAYNDQQERPERKIKDYFQKIKKDKQKNYAYEMIVGVYKKDNENITEETQKKILKEFTDNFVKKYGNNIKVVGAYYHFDECGNDPHLHLDFIPVAYNQKKGMTTQNSLTQALAQLGFYTENKSLTSQMKFERECNDYLESLCKKNNIDVKHPMREYHELTGKHIRHKSTHQYIYDKLVREIERAERIQSESYKVFTELQTNKQKLAQLQDQIANLNEEELKPYEALKVELLARCNELKIEHLKLQEELKKDTERIKKARENFERKEVHFDTPKIKKPLLTQSGKDVRLDKKEYEDLIKRVNQLTIDYQNMFDKDKEEIEKEKQNIEYIKGWENKEKYNQEIEKLYKKEIPRYENTILSLQADNQFWKNNYDKKVNEIEKKTHLKYEGYVKGYQELSDRMDKIDNALQKELNISIDELLKKITKTQSHTL
jgi:hypothetical protein